MFVRSLLSAAIAVAVLTPALTAQAPAGERTLKLGDRAPKLENVTWHQGRVESYEPGKVYVLDFWAPWCGPCIAAMPHMNKVTEEYKDKGVVVIGLSIWPTETMTPVSDFLAARNERGESLKYLIGEDDEKQTNANAYMRAAQQNGIPTVMIVNQQGRLAWMGHPMGGMDAALEKIVAGTWDIEAEIAKAAKVAELQPQLRPAYMAKDWDRLFRVIDELVKIDPDQFSYMLLEQYVLILTEIKDKDRAARHGETILKSKLSDNAGLMNQFAWYIVNPKNGMAKEDRDLNLAVRAVDRAIALTEGKDADVLDTQARVYFWKGDLDRAIEIQSRAVELSDERTRPVYEEALDEYRAAKAPHTPR